MNRHPVEKLFSDKKIRLKIQQKLPLLFQMAEIECSRSGKTGMQVGSLRENIINALLVYVFGKKHVITNIPITAHEVDVILHDKPISIKSFTGRGYSGVKLIWTVDQNRARHFSENYSPSCDIIFIRINWGSDGEFSFIPLSTQKTLFSQMGYKNYFKLPKEGTNPRGVEISSQALQTLLNDDDTQKINISWVRKDIKENPYERWIEYWRNENDLV